MSMSASKITIPSHIAIIMDGNRRWARQHKLEALKGHEYVANKVIEELVVEAINQGVKYLTLWAFSTENWQREQAEVQGLMGIFRSAFKKNAQRLHELGVRLNTIGDPSRFPADIQENVGHWLKLSKKNTKITVTFALNYGGRDEILRAINKLKRADQSQNQSSAHQPLTEADFAQYLDTAGLPDPELIIRPGGEQRLSGYLPWQSVYCELYFTDVLMPDFGATELQKAIAEFSHRQRRFGR